MRERFTSVVTDLLDGDTRTAVVLAVIGHAGFEESGATRRHPRRVIDVGIREQAMVGVAAGLALEGMRPFVHSYAPFLVERPFEQIKLDLAHQGVGSVLVSIGASFDAAAEGRTHQSPGDVALASTIPGMRIEVPGHPDEVESMLRRAARTDELTYIRLSTQANRAALVADGSIGVARIGTAGAATVLAIGPMLDPVLEAVADLDMTVLYSSTAKPLDRAGLMAARTGDALAVVEPYLEATSAAEVLSAIGPSCVKTAWIGIRHGELRRYGTPEDHRVAQGLDPGAIRARIARDLM
ncbi:MAG: transketolase [Acidimicrobiia bacterium]|nr:transketolase [Acidimicrobiia bacterium]MDH4306930.1 transketolase [Acidimicrobiia bacterium]MDH5294087.1 transketolase [Acidimicrobiia bacterium]